MPQMHRASLAGSYFSRSTREGVAKLCVKFWKKWKLASSFLWLGCEIAYSWLTHKNSFEEVFQQNRFGFLEKLSKPKWYTKTLLKTNKILKKNFGFDHQAIEYTQITFEHNTNDKITLTRFRHLIYLFMPKDGMRQGYGTPDLTPSYLISNCLIR